jgi:hypothetical protein
MVVHQVMTNSTRDLFSPLSTSKIFENSKISEIACTEIQLKISLNFLGWLVLNLLVAQTSALTQTGKDA